MAEQRRVEGSASSDACPATSGTAQHHVGTRAFDSYVFVYGTLRKPIGHAMHHVLDRVARFVGDANVHGVLYDLGTYPGLVTDEDDGDLVIGEVYVLVPERAEAALADLDAYEGCAPADALPHEYRRERVQVTLVDGSRIAAWTYVLNKPRTGLTRIAGGDYLVWRRGGAHGR